MNQLPFDDFFDQDKLLKEIDDLLNAFDLQDFSKNSLLFLSRTGNGKSTAIHYIRNKPLIFKGKRVILSPNNLDPKIGNTTKHGTDAPAPYLLEDLDVNIWDTPGFCDVAEFKIEILNSFYIQKLFNKLGHSNVKIIYFIEESKLESGDRGNEFVNEIRQFTNYFKDFEKIEDSVLIILSKSSIFVDIDEAIEKIFEILKFHKKIEENVQSSLKKIANTDKIFLFGRPNPNNGNEIVEFVQPETRNILLGKIEKLKFAKADSIKVNHILSDQSQSLIIKITKSMESEIYENVEELNHIIEKMIENTSSKEWNNEDEFSRKLNEFKAISKVIAQLKESMYPVPLSEINEPLNFLFFGNSETEIFNQKINQISKKVDQHITYRALVPQIDPINHFKIIGILKSTEETYDQHIIKITNILEFQIYENVEELNHIIKKMIENISSQGWKSEDEFNSKLNDFKVISEVIALLKTSIYPFPLSKISKLLEFSQNENIILIINQISKTLDYYMTYRALGQIHPIIDPINHYKIICILKLSEETYDQHVVKITKNLESQIYENVEELNHIIKKMIENTSIKGWNNEVELNNKLHDFQTISEIIAHLKKSINPCSLSKINKLLESFENSQSQTFIREISQISKKVDQFKKYKELVQQNELNQFKIIFSLKSCEETYNLENSHFQKIAEFLDNICREFLVNLADAIKQIEKKMISERDRFFLQNILHEVLNNEEENINLSRLMKRLEMFKEKVLSLPNLYQIYDSFTEGQREIIEKIYGDNQLKNIYEKMKEILISLKTIQREEEKSLNFCCFTIIIFILILLLFPSSTSPNDVQEKVEYQNPNNYQYKKPTNLAIPSKYDVQEKVEYQIPNSFQYNEPTNLYIPNIFNIIPHETRSELIEQRKETKKSYSLGSLINIGTVDQTIDENEESNQEVLGALINFGEIRQKIIKKEKGFFEKIFGFGSNEKDENE